MASTSPAKKKAATPARRRTEVEMFEMTSEIDDDGNYTAEIYGETFTLSSDVNAWLLIEAGAGEPKAIVSLVHSLLVVEPEDGEDLDAARRRVQKRFTDHIGAQRNFSVERLVEFIADITEAAGNDLAE